MSKDTQNCISSNVVSLDQVRQICRTAETGAAMEQVSNPAHVQLLPGEKRAHVHDSNPAHGQLLPFPKTAHVRHSTPQRVAGLSKGENPIGRNERLRQARAKAWRKAVAKLEYWQAWRKIHNCIGKAQNHGFLNEVNCPDLLVRLTDFEEPWKLDTHILGDVMVAERQLLLTPAPAIAALNWKRKRSRHQWYRLADGSIEGEIDRAIEADQKWLDAHPARQCRSNQARPK